MKIIIDCLGGDNGARATVEGALAAMRKLDDLSVIFVGDEKEIGTILKEHEHTESRIDIIHAPTMVDGNDRPMEAVRMKRESSMMRAIRELRDREDIDGMVSVGATGCLIAGVTMMIPRIGGVRRPAFCPILPTMTGGIVGICDSGANMVVSPEQLQQYAIMGSRYLRAAYKIENPRVALLNVGKEEEKGDQLRLDAFKLLQNTPDLNFVGNMEARELLSGEIDLVVCDAFSGNVLVKSVEGTALELLKKIKKDIYSKSQYKFGALFMKKMFMEEKEFMNYQNYGGSVFLGTEKTVVKGHGSADRKAIFVCISQARRMIRRHLTEEIGKAIEKSIPKDDE